MLQLLCCWLVMLQIIFRWSYDATNHIFLELPCDKSYVVEAVVLRIIYLLKLLLHVPHILRVGI
jgi:hypothetical protein